MTSLAIVWDPPAGIDLGFFTFKFYSLMWVAAFGVGLWIMTKVFKAEKLNEQQITNTLYFVFWGTILGARIGHCVFYEWGYYKDHLLEIILPFQLSPFKLTGYQGLASHGAAVGILIGMFFCARHLKKPFLWLMDRLVIVVALGGAFIRLGNFFNSEIVGKITGTSYGVIFKQNPEDFPLFPPRHPAQLYEAFGYILLFVLLWWMYKRGLAKYQGLIFGIFMIILFSLRFFIEFVKENQMEFEDSMSMNMGQLLSIPFILAGAALALYSLIKKHSNN